MISNILTVCKGNLCRSPMATALLAARLSGVHVRCAGTHAVVGRPPAREAIELLAVRDIDISGYRAMQLSLSLCNEADLILVMDSEQKREVESRYAVTRGKVFLVRGFDNSEVFDPVGQPVDQFQRCIELIEEGVDYWVSRLGRVSNATSDARRAIPALTRAPKLEAWEQ
ncbi:low molecular weight phosphotyrosine protein phosphatase [Paraburkholderia madseniana]|uniref:low molecular weight protein-tyrosine-phosphatase n=1 Tax=Paraburkholderia madseniana TaxID=2599607 RepID=UPI0038B8C039